MGDAFGVLTVILAAVSAAYTLSALAAWVPAATAADTSLVAYIAAARYDHQVIEFLRTAQRLEDLRDGRGGEGPHYGGGVRRPRSGAAISIENEGWMARWTTEATPNDPTT